MARENLDPYILIFTGVILLALRGRQNSLWFASAGAGVVLTSQIDLEGLR